MNSHLLEGGIYMYIVTNTIQTETDHSEKIIQQFTAGHTKENMDKVDGFVDFQLMHRLLPDNPQVTELVVLSRWESKEHQKGWVKSQSFKNMHKKPSAAKETAQEQPKKRPGVISSTISEYEALI